LGVQKKLLTSLLRAFLFLGIALPADLSRVTLAIRFSYKAPVRFSYKAPVLISCKTPVLIIYQAPVLVFE
jgi:hypothetical protein